MSKMTELYTKCLVHSGNCISVILIPRSETPGLPKRLSRLSVLVPGRRIVPVVVVSPGEQVSEIRGSGLQWWKMRASTPRQPMLPPCTFIFLRARACKQAVTVQARKCRSDWGIYLPSIKWTRRKEITQRLCASRCSGIEMFSTCF